MCCPKLPVVFKLLAIFFHHLQLLIVFFQPTFVLSVLHRYFISLSFCIITMILLVGCNKESLPLSYSEITLPGGDRLEAVFFVNDSIGHIVGGKTFSRGIHWSTYDAGTTWQSDSFAISTGYDVHYTQTGIGYQAGLAGVYKKFGREENWFINSFPTIFFSVPPLNAIDINTNDKILVAGGIGFQNGIVMALDETGGLLALDTFPNEISDIVYVDPQIAIAVGYGLVIRSTDGGLTWQQLPVFNDFFRAVHFPTSTTGYMVGFSGSILKSVDAGLTWKYLRNGDRLTTSNQPFRSVFFHTETSGFAVGDNGLCWYTSDGGKEWQPVDNLPDRDFYNVFIQNEVGYLVGEQGSVIKFMIP